jgi:membrane associated rhomboid family serine protease
MGIHDRDYIREQRPGGRVIGGGASVGGIRALSVNTWLIVICIAIFVIDGFLVNHIRLEPSGRMLVPQGVIIDEAQVDLDYDRATMQPPAAHARQGMAFVPMVDRSTGITVGWHEHFIMTPIRWALFFSTQRGFLNLEVWRLIGFQFLHGDLMHLLFNMIALYFFGPLIEQHLGSKRYLAFYLLCGICGAMLYTVLNLLGIVAQIMGLPSTIPGLLFNLPTTPLIGASAGVFGVLMAGAYIAPRATVLLFFILPMQLRTLAYALVVIAFVSLFLGTRNAGGEAGHLGGAMAGWYFIRNPRHLHGFFDFLGRFDPTSRHFRGRHTGTPRDAASRKEIDRILDKINREGLHSLTDVEKRKLREASRGEG